MADLVDPVDILRTRPPGSALFVRTQLSAGGPWDVSWLIREESRRIAALARPDLEFRAGALGQRFQGQEVLVIPILLRIGPERPESLFEVWLNVWVDDGKGLLELETLAAQDRLVLHFYGESPAGRLAGGGWAPERSLVMTNQLKTFATEALAQLAGRPAWSMVAFDRARAQLEARYPTVEALWRALLPREAH